MILLRHSERTNHLESHHGSLHNHSSVEAGYAITWQTSLGAKISLHCTAAKMYPSTTVNCNHASVYFYICSEYHAKKTSALIITRHPTLPLRPLLSTATLRRFRINLIFSSSALQSLRINLFGRLSLLGRIGDIEQLLKEARNQHPLLLRDLFSE